MALGLSVLCVCVCVLANDGFLQASFTIQIELLLNMVNIEKYSYVGNA